MLKVNNVISKTEESIRQMQVCAIVGRWDKDTNHLQNSLKQVFSHTQRLETKKHCKAIYAASSASLRVGWVLFTLPPNITCPPQVLPHYMSCSACKSVLAKCHVIVYQLTSLCPSAWGGGRGKKLAAYHWRVFGAFLAMESRQTGLKMWGGPIHAWC